MIFFFFLFRFAKLASSLKMALAKDEKYFFRNPLLARDGDKTENPGKKKKQIQCCLTSFPTEFLVKFKSHTQVKKKKERGGKICWTG